MTVATATAIELDGGEEDDNLCNSKFTYLTIKLEREGDEEVCMLFFTSVSSSLSFKLTNLQTQSQTPCFLKSWTVLSYMILHGHGNFDILGCPRVI